MDGVILGFSGLTKRNKYEFYALKIWLYMLQVRDSSSPYIHASYEKINEGTGVPEKEIPRAYGILLRMGLLKRVGKEKDDNSEISKTANAYHSVGYKDFSPAELQRLTRAQQALKIEVILRLPFSKKRKIKI